MAKNSTEGSERPPFFSITTASDRRYRDYYAAIGVFVTSFTHVETVLYYILIRYTGVTDETARAIFSGTRMDTAAGYLRRLSEQKLIPTDEWSYLERCLTQITRITATRNLILHYGVENLASKRATASNAQRAISRVKARTVPVTVQDLDDMCWDLESIAHALYAFNRRSGVLTKKVRREAAEWLQTPWRYTPPQPKPRRPHRGGKLASSHAGRHHLRSNINRLRHGGTYGC